MQPRCATPNDGSMPAVPTPEADPAIPPLPDNIGRADLGGEQYAALGGNTVSVSDPLALAPNMVGDFFGVVGNGSTNFRTGSIYVPSPGATVGKIKIAENTSPIPRDRVYFGYSYFGGVPLNGTGLDVNRFTPGFEKTFFSKMTSIDVRTPVATTMSNDVFIDGNTQSDQAVFGNMVTTFKALLWQSDNRFAISSGLGLQLPTGPSTHVRTPGGVEFLRVDQASVHYQPFVGYVFTPNSRFFAQGFMQVDIDGNGSRVSAITANRDRITLGRVQDQNLLYSDFGFGYWAVQNFDRAGRMSGFAPIVEMHYNKSVSNGSNLRANGVVVGNTLTNFENLNLTFGANIAMKSNTWATVAYVVPVGGGPIDRQMNGEFRLLLNRFFGPMTRFQRTQF
jgi:hypothetical protein